MGTRDGLNRQLQSQELNERSYEAARLVRTPKVTDTDPWCSWAILKRLFGNGTSVYCTFTE